MNQNNIKPQDLMATDLRIGNWIADHNEEKRFFKVEQITYSDKSNVYYIHYNNGCTKCQVKYLDPIPLSEEVLLKCGFKRIANLISGSEIEIVYYQNGKIIVYLLKDFFEIEIETSSGIFNLHHTFEKHLHQLQNLFYSLTQIELEVSF